MKKLPLVVKHDFINKQRFTLKKELQYGEVSPDKNENQKEAYRRGNLIVLVEYLLFGGFLNYCSDTPLTPLFFFTVKPC